MRQGRFYRNLVLTYVMIVCCVGGEDWPQIVIDMQTEDVLGVVKGLILQSYRLKLVDNIMLCAPPSWVNISPADFQGPRCLSDLIFS